MTAGALLPVWRTASVLFFFFFLLSSSRAYERNALFCCFFPFSFFFFIFITCFSPLFVLLAAAISKSTSFLLSLFLLCIGFYLLQLLLKHTSVFFIDCLSRNLVLLFVCFFFFRILCFSAIMTPIFLVSFFFSVLSRRLRRPLACFCFAQ